MYFEPDDDARALQTAVRELCAEFLPLERTREWTDAASFDRAAWRELAELGAFTVTQPGDHGGAELGTAHAGLVFQVLGAELVPGPLVAASLAADVDDQVGAGVTVATVVTEPPEVGRPAVIGHLDLADVVFLVTADAVRRIPADAITAARRVPKPLDPTTPVWLAGTLPRGDEVGGPELARSWRQRGSVLGSALLVGNAGRTVDLAVAYAKQREQFGRAIGGFQAIKHLLADAFARVEVARAAVDAAAVALDDGPDSAPVGPDGSTDLDGSTDDVAADPGPAGWHADPTADPARSVAGARVLAARAATTNAKTAIQVHGGMGFTWETTPHLYLRRAWLLQNAFTTPDEAADAVAWSLLRRRAS